MREIESYSNIAAYDMNFDYRERLLVDANIDVSSSPK